MSIQLPLPVTRAYGRAVLTTRKHTPDILLGTGIVCVGGGLVAMFFAARKVDEPTQKWTGRCRDIRQMHEDGIEGVDETTVRTDLVRATGEYSLKLAQIFAPTIALTTVGVSCLIASRNIQQSRLAAVSAAYAGSERAFALYRDRVKDILGPEKELELRNGIREKTVTDEETGDTETHKVLDTNGISQYAKFFDDSSREWERNAEYNRAFLHAQQEKANDMLLSRGHLFLNEVYDMLGLPRTQAGAVVGWVSDPLGDKKVDFGIFDLDSQVKRDFVNGYEKAILLDFNVDGVIYDMI